jgi:MFS family permease
MTPLDSHPPTRRSAFAGVTPYHVLVVLIASAGWLFDCMDQALFSLARQSALTELLKGGGDAVEYAGYATTSMIIGWATGGILFGMMSDRVGRVKTMVATLLIYSGFTGLSGLAMSPAAFIGYRFLVGLGVGGMFGAATTLVAESVPSGFRALALGSLQALSAAGNVMGGMIARDLIPPGSAFELGGYVISGWRALFFVGVLPALLVVPMIIILREPEGWKQAKKAAQRGEPGHKVGSLADMFRDARWRHHAIIGLLLGVSGMIGLWGVGFFSPELVSKALEGQPQEVVDRVRSSGFVLQNIGAFFGMLTFTFVATFLSRRVAFLGSFILCLVTTIFVFKSLNSPTDAYWMLPLMGFAQLGVFAGYSIYFPELFPTRLRGTGVGFCYNTVRYLAAPAPALLGVLSTQIGFRNAAAAMAFVYVVGMVALIWAPETKGKPLPED